MRNSKKANTVRIYDPKTKSVSEIPAAELAPGYVLINQEGIGLVYTKVDDLNLSVELRHPPFSREVRRILRWLKKTLEEVYPQTTEKWEDDFRREQHPNREILIWVGMVQVYKKCLSTLRPVDVASRKACFRIVLSCGTNGPEHALHVLDVPAESRDVALRIVEIFKAPPDEDETAELRRVAAIIDAYFGSQQEGQSEA